LAWVVEDPNDLLEAYECKIFFKSLLVFSRKTVLPLFLVFLLLRNYSAQAQSQAVSGSNFGKKTQTKDKPDDWISFPYTIQISPYIGATSNIPQLLAPNSTTRTGHYRSKY